VGAPRLLQGLSGTQMKIRNPPLLKSASLSDAIGDAFQIISIYRIPYNSIRDPVLNIRSRQFQADTLTWDCSPSPSLTNLGEQPLVRLERVASSTTHSRRGLSALDATKLLALASRLSFQSEDSLRYHSRLG
jgi:hypothetical protein